MLIGVIHDDFIFDILMLSSKAAFTFQFFLFELMKTRGAKSLGFFPLSQRASQKGVFAALPTMIFVTAYFYIPRKLGVFAFWEWNSQF
jgi:hypothetical protein